MKNANKVTIVLMLAVIIAVACAVDSFLPQKLDSELEFWNIYPKDNIEYVSENYTVGSKEYFVYAALSYSESDESDKYVICTGEIKGIRNNKYQIDTYTEKPDEYLASAQYIDIYDFPDWEIKNGGDYFGSVYTGTVPASCTSVTIQGQEAEMVRQTFEFNGQEVDFYLYYCVVEEEYPNGAEVIVTDTDGNTYSVSTADGAEQPIVTVVS